MKLDAASNNTKAGAQYEEMRMLRKVGIGIAVAAVLVRFSIFISPVDLSDLLNPMMSIVTAWVLSPMFLLG